MVRKFPTFRSERKKRTTSGGSPQFPNGFSGKLLFHLTFKRNFRIFWLNCKHPRYRQILTCSDFVKSSLSDSVEFSGKFEICFPCLVLLENISFDKIFEAVTQKLAIRCK